MKTRITVCCFLCLLFLPVFSFAQAGLGVGSQGVVFKTGADAKYALVSRLGFQLGSGGAVRPQINLVGRMVNELKAKLYGGIGAGASLLAEADVLPDGSIDSIEYFLLRAPLGVEYFPFQTKHFSITAETGLDYFVADNRTDRRGNIQFSGLLEITFYFAKNR